MSERYKLEDLCRGKFRYRLFDAVTERTVIKYESEREAADGLDMANLAHERSGAEELRKALEEAPEALANPSEDWAEKYANWYEDRRYFLAKWTPKP